MFESWCGQCERLKHLSDRLNDGGCSTPIGFYEQERG